MIAITTSSSTKVKARRMRASHGCERIVVIRLRRFNFWHAHAKTAGFQLLAASSAANRPSLAGRLAADPLVRGRDRRSLAARLKKQKPGPPSPVTAALSSGRLDNRRRPNQAAKGRTSRPKSPEEFGCGYRPAAASRAYR